MHAIDPRRGALVPHIAKNYYAHLLQVTHQNMHMWGTVLHVWEHVNEQHEKMASLMDKLDLAASRALSCDSLPRAVHAMDPYSACHTTICTC
jgi:hypothetical protein